jgi:hypothetical protein
VTRGFPARFATAIMGWVAGFVNQRVKEGAGIVLNGKIWG